MAEFRIMRGERLPQLMDKRRTVVLHLDRYVEARSQGWQMMIRRNGCDTVISG